jgi:predicted small secreted protein
VELPDGIGVALPKPCTGFYEEAFMSKSLSPLFAVAAIAGALSLGASNTVQGAGADIEQAGEHIEERADELNDGNPNTP